MDKAERNQIKSLTHKSLILSIYMLFAVFLLLLGSVIFESIKYSVSAFYPISGILIGILIGILFSRMRHISWDKSASLIVGRTDLYGGIILVGYIIFDLNRTRLLSHFLSGELLAVVSLSVLAGIMYGRVLGMRNSIRNVLKLIA